MSIEDLMADLKISYIADLPQKIKTIQDHLEQGSTEQVRDGFHKLKGTGKTYGLPEVSELCALLEKLCIEQEDRIGEFAPLGIQLLNHIHQLRSKDETPDLENHSSYKQLKELS